MIEVRRRHGIATPTQLDVPDVSHRAMLVTVQRLERDDALQVTVLNFCREEINGTVRSEHLPAGSEVTDTFTDASVGVVDDLHSFSVSLEAYGGTSLLVKPGLTPPRSARAT